MHKRQLYFYFLILLICGITIYFIIPVKENNKPFSLALYDVDNKLLSARIADDQQWRFPSPDTIPYKYKKALIEYEDKRFYKHAGLDPLAILRAIRDNFKKGRITSGASTITMQLSRLRSDHEERSFWNKFMETMEALKIEMHYSKNEILRKYATLAPFGSNIVGIEAASRRYFGKNPSHISWAEAALLAVLPNNPALIFPGRNQDKLILKRNNLLKDLLQKRIIDSLSFSLATTENIPSEWTEIPHIAPHALQFYKKKFPDKTYFHTSLNKSLQKISADILRRHKSRLMGNSIHNAALLLINIKQKKVLAYQGNLPNLPNKYAAYVDHVQAIRSPGSLLKPILTMESIADGIVLPQTLIRDIPTHLGSYTPQNYDKKWRGLVPLSQALIHSLNIPYVRLLNRYNLNRFYKELPKYGLRSYKNHSAAYYGLPIILGGGGSTLWQLTSAYAGIARLLTKYADRSGQYSKADFKPPLLFHNSRMNDSLQFSPPVIDAGSAFLTYNMMKKLQRPPGQGQWEAFASAQGIAWKTGTSIGFRDAWAIGFNADYAIGVWVGNADNEGRSGLIGVKAAAPIMFDLFEYLRGDHNIETPHDALKSYKICKFSGLLASEPCPVDTVKGPVTLHELKLCHYHRRIWLHPETGKRVNRSCLKTGKIPESKIIIELPPRLSYYYKKSHTFHIPHIPWDSDCQFTEENYLAITYPTQSAQIALPRGVDGSFQKLVCTASINNHSPLYWYLDEKYIGKTTAPHHLTIQPQTQVHRLTIVDNKGNEDNITFQLIEAL